ncbi:hypothetical protein SDC9_62346 [bioreactor metagenome]|uniref:Uncharacterized protein n=1 Tax=bioreactor metagenome TaxID=1076179 RepID=A0A644XID8_9ZZZZ
MGEEPRECLQSGDSGAGLVLGKGQPLGRRYADPQAGERTGSCSHRNHVHFGKGGAAVFKEGRSHGHQGAAVGESAVLEGLGDQPLVLTEGSRRGHSGGIQGKYFQDFVTSPRVAARSSPPPVIVIKRMFSSPFRRRSTRRHPSSRSSGATSLHSTAQTPPRRR